MSLLPLNASPWHSTNFVDGQQSSLYHLSWDKNHILLDSCFKAHRDSTLIMKEGMSKLNLLFNNLPFKYNHKTNIRFFLFIFLDFQSASVEKIFTIWWFEFALIWKCLPCTKNAISEVPFDYPKSLTTNFSPELQRKKAQQILSYKNLMKGNKTTNNEGIVFFTHTVCDLFDMETPRK